MVSVTFFFTVFFPHRCHGPPGCVKCLMSIPFWVVEQVYPWQQLEGQPGRLYGTVPYGKCPCARYDAVNQIYLKDLLICFGLLWHTLTLAFTTAGFICFFSA